MSEYRHDATALLQRAHAEADGRPAVYVITLLTGLQNVDAGLIKALWIELWKEVRQVAPPLVILDESKARITALSDDALHDVGLMRIPGARLDG